MNGCFCCVRFSFLKRNSSFGTSLWTLIETLENSGLSKNCCSLQPAGTVVDHWTTTVNSLWHWPCTFVHNAMGVKQCIVQVRWWQIRPVMTYVLLYAHCKRPFWSPVSNLHIQTWCNWTVEVALCLVVWTDSATVCGSLDTFKIIILYILFTSPRLSGDSRDMTTRRNSSTPYWTCASLAIGPTSTTPSTSVEPTLALSASLLISNL